MHLAIGTRLGPYEIVAPLGVGGMGEVYRARDPRLGRDVAIKVLPARLSSDPDARARFERETRAVAALSHSNIVAIFDVGVVDGFTYAVTELLDGETLRSRLAHGAMSWRQAAEIAAAIADGLAAVHADEAFAWLERAYRERDSWVNYIGVDPRLDPLAGDRRFSDLLTRLKLSRHAPPGRP
jgi:serine/threonine protein kinase